MFDALEMPQKKVQVLMNVRWFSEAIESKNKIQNLLRCACSSLLMVIGYSGFLKNASTLWKYFKNIFIN